MSSPVMPPSFPLYVLPDGNGWQVLISPGRRDMTHPMLWKLCGARILATRLGVEARSLTELPYACHRARVVDNVVYWGGDLSVAQRKAVTAALKGIGLERLTWKQDEHEVRQDDDRERMDAVIGQRARPIPQRGQRPGQRPVSQDE